ncbi:tubulin nucleotide-binding domain-like protein [Epithele typhae]|uniref:tubulin nucleotide-binding domain-like protein n=1 Tax=Epithele typhae TaxID=378194 RepID=UPI0020084043|nr:tubulin nucleotide-binding domain-like protein [Epithele typhae]KAH9922329.1 tubulin nucleotide-binding domain-like protein [Epithele typhae]
MREILYVQAGPLANHVGTHFWNAQESYFTYDDESEPQVFHDRSFREGLTATGEQTYCPRVLLIDRKSQFGSLPSGLYGTENDLDATQWSVRLNGIVEFRQDSVSKSAYHTRLDQRGPAEDEDDAEPAEPTTIRFWSDYSRVYFHPRSPHRLPDPAEWEDAQGDWLSSKRAFAQHHTGIQLLSDSVTFGGFTDAFLTAFRDDFPKLPSLAFPILSPASFGSVDVDQQDEAMKALNDALVLKGLEDLSTMNAPLQAPTTWRFGAWSDDLNANVGTIHLGAVTATLPLRLKSLANQDLFSLSTTLNRSGDFKTLCLSGMYPLSTPFDLSMDTERRIYDLSSPADSDKSLVVPRLTSPFAVCTPSLTQLPPHSPSSRALPAPTLRHRALSTLTASSAPSRLFAAHARVAQACVDRRAAVVVHMGLEFDDVRELKDDLWALCDRYAGDDAHGTGPEAEDEFGEDEE